MLTKLAKAAAFVLAMSTASHAATVSAVLPETNEFDGGPFDIGTFVFDVIDVAQILSVNLMGSFGNSEFSGSSASTPIIVDGIQAAICDDGTFGPMLGCQGFDFSFDFDSADFAQFSDGEAVVTGDFLGGGAVRISELTLTITTGDAPTPVPLPAGLPLLLVGLGGLAVLRRKRV